MSEEPEYRSVNRAWWDERVPIHAASEFYDLEGFVAGQDSLMPYELALLGDVEGLDLVHPQCHMGQDTLSWARRGARVTGLDFSAPAIEVAQGLARRLGVDARFVVADVDDAVEVLGATYDVAFQSLGSLNWHPDVVRWAGVLAELVRPGGRYLLTDSHPFAWVLDDDGERVAYQYFHDPAGERFVDDGGTYADRSAKTEHNVTIEFAHTISDVLNALIGAGFTIERIEEHDYTLCEIWPWLEEHEGGVWRAPEGRVALPMMYSVLARKGG